AADVFALAEHTRAEHAHPVAARDAHPAEPCLQRSEPLDARGSGDAVQAAIVAEGWQMDAVSSAAEGRLATGGVGVDGCIGVNASPCACALCFHCEVRELAMHAHP